MFKHYKIKLLFLLIFPAILISGCSQSGPEIIINQQRFKLEVARTPAEQYLGLSKREKLCSDCGMIFLVNKTKVPVFVMREMNFPLDIIWIKNNQIIQINQNLLPEGKIPKKLYSPQRIVDYVLEINGGLSQKYNFQVGQKIILHL